MKRKNWSNIILIVVFFVGLSVLLYPTVSDYWNSLHQSRAIATYSDAVEEMDTSDYERMWADVSPESDSSGDESSVSTSSTGTGVGSVPSDVSSSFSLLSFISSGSVLIFRFSFAILLEASFATYVTTTFESSTS